jgi:hypothetical protein
MKKAYRLARVDSLNITMDLIKNPHSFIGLCTQFGWFVTLFGLYWVEDMKGNLK